MLRLVTFLGLVGASFVAVAGAQDDARTVLTEKIELPRLVDLSAQRLGVNIQYDAAQLKGQLLLRLGRGVSDDELWILTNRLLASRKFTSIQMPGEDTINIVPLNEAAALARVEEGGLEDAIAGYVKLMIDIEHRPAKEVIEPLKLVLSQGTGTATAIGETGKLMLADLKPRLVQALDLLELLDVPPAEITTERIDTTAVLATDVVARVTEIATARGAVSGQPLKGKLIADPDGRSVVVIAAAAEVDAWRQLIREVDVGEPLDTRTYTPLRFSLTDTGGLIEQVVRDESEATKRGWRMITDELSGTLVVTTTAPLHERVEELVNRLDAIPPLSGALVQIPTEHVAATPLIALVEKVAQLRGQVTGQPLKGELMASPDEKSLLLVAPEDERAVWQDLVDRMDQREALETASYSPKYFPVAEVARLLEQVAGGSTTADSGWRLIEDSLTGTLVVTGTPSQHVEIRQLIERLDAAAPTTRRPFRSFVLRNRSAAELVTLLRELISQGALEPEGGAAADGDPAAGGASPAAGQVPGVPASSAGQEQPRAAEGGVQIAIGDSELLVTADENTNTLIAVGEPRLLEQLQELIDDLDRRQPQVMLEVLVLALSESDALDLGVELQRLQTPDGTIVELAQLFGLGSPDLNDSASRAALGTGLTGVVLDPGRFSVLISALQSLNEGRSLTVPRVLVNNNEQAVLDSTQESPYTSTNASNTVATTSFGGTLDAGTKVTVTPLIAEGDHLVLEYEIEVSQFLGESSDPALPPPRQLNKLQSVVTIPDGYKVALGGLDTESESEAIGGIPLLRSLPLIGHLFESRRTSVTRSRFFVFLGATVLRDNRFEDLRYLSGRQLEEAELEDGWPRVEPRLIR